MVLSERDLRAGNSRNSTTWRPIAPEFVMLQFQPVKRDRSNSQFVPIPTPKERFNVGPAPTPGPPAVARGVMSPYMKWQFMQ